MVSTETFALFFVIKTPSFDVRLCSGVCSFSNFQKRIRGKSPLLTEQTAVTDSSKLNSSSPKLNGEICGKTWKNEFNLISDFKKMSTSIYQQIAKIWQSWDSVKFVITIDWQIRGMCCHSTAIMCMTSVVSPMSSFYCINDQHTNFLARSSYCNAIVTR